MRLSLGFRMDLRQLQTQVPSHVFCLLPLFELTLGGLKRLEEYVKSLSPEEIESLGSISRGGSGRKAFNDINLESLLEELGATGINNPDVRLKINNNKLFYEYNSERIGEDFVPLDNEESQGLLRNSQTLLRNIRWVDSAIRQAYEIILDHQNEYLFTNDPSKLEPLKLADIADRMGVHFTTVSRLIKGKSVRSLDGHIMPLNSLLVQEYGINKLRAYKVISQVIIDGNYPDNDDELVKMVYEMTGGDIDGVLLARRTITEYRRDIEERMFKDIYGVAFYALNAALKDKAKKPVKVIDKMEFATIFDMDGVLVDSHEAIWNSHNEVLGTYGVHLSDEDIKLYLGKSLRDDIAAWNEKYGINLDLETHTRVSWEIQLRIYKDMKPDEGLVALLDDLKSHKVPMGVGTSSQRFRAEAILDILKIRDYFPVVVTANDVKLHKPNPDLFLEVARKLKVYPEKCLVIEDAQNGIVAAKRGKMKTIGYLNGHNDQEELKGSNLVISSFSQLSYERIRKMIYHN